MGYNISLLDILDLVSGTVHIVNNQDAEDEVFFGSKDDFYDSDAVFAFLDSHNIEADQLCVDTIEADPGLSVTLLITVYW